MNMQRLLPALLFLIPPTSVAVADTVLIPVVAAYGQNDASWRTEIRLTNRADSSRTLNVVDWIGTPGWRPTTYVIQPHSITSIGGSDFFGAFAPPGTAGLAICNADPDLLVQTAVLVGIRGGGVNYSCPSWDGGGGPCPGPVGAGPVVEGLTFFNAGAPLYLSWLHTADDRRTNLVLVNPDDTAAQVSISVVSQDGLVTISQAVLLPARSYTQFNDLFSSTPWSAIRDANYAIFHGGAAASATLTSSGRMVAMAYVISNYNNSLTINIPR